jgi:hypothetical protein
MSMNDDPSDKIEEHVPDDTGSTEPRAEPRALSFLDLLGQQLVASRAQAQATIAACDAALLSVSFLRAQADAIEHAAAADRAKARGEITKPATFGRRRRAQTEGGTDGTATE